MLFNSTLFLIYLPLVVIAYYQLSLRQRQVLLLLASYLFYWVWSVPYSLLLVLSTVVDYSVARWMDSASNKMLRYSLLLVSMAVNLGLLAIFKYADFVSNSVMAALGWRPWPPLVQVFDQIESGANGVLASAGIESSLVLEYALPLGISFYTFQTMSYTIDVFRRELRANKSFLEMALFVSFFPQLVAGPIVRASDLMPQLAQQHRLDWDNIRVGVSRIMWGLVKKVYFADTMAHIANEIYSDPERSSGFGLMMATYAFAIQIYCDFSGYSDIAIGAARLLGVKLPENFRSPYLSLSIREFWRRWHISLSSWLRDYLYIPLGGSRQGSWRTYLNLMITMLLGGLWHGAGWNWVVWGGLQGAVMSAERFFNIKEKHPEQLGWRLLRWIVTFHIVCVSWVLFRARDLEQAGLVLGKIVTGAAGEYYHSWEPLIVMAILLLVEMANGRQRWLAAAEERKLPVRWLAYGAAILFVLTFQGARNPEFIYFQF